MRPQEAINMTGLGRRAKRKLGNVNVTSYLWLQKDLLKRSFAVIAFKWIDTVLCTLVTAAAGLPIECYKIACSKISNGLLEEVSGKKIVLRESRKCVVRRCSLLAVFSSYTKT